MLEELRWVARQVLRLRDFPQVMLKEGSAGFWNNLLLDSSFRPFDGSGDAFT